MQSKLIAVLSFLLLAVQVCAEELPVLKTQKDNLATLPGSTWREASGGKGSRSTGIYL